MLLDRLTAYYGIGGAEEIEFINRRIDSYTEAGQERLFDLITAECSKRYGFPDLQKLNKVFADVAPDGSACTQKRWFWRVCRKCGAQFWDDLMFCPVCFRKGEKVTEADLKTSSTPPGKEVIRFNKCGFYEDGNYKPCVTCVHGTNGRCPSFGNAKFDCMKRVDCPCNECCMRAMER